MNRRSLILAAFLVFPLSACGDGRNGSPNSILVEGVSERSFFYRMIASFIVVETGEVIDFNFVVGCGVETTWWRAGGGRTERASWTPKNMVMPTADGGAILLRPPKVCDDRILSEVPADFMPFVIWFDDVNDMDFGWGHATEAAYEGPNAKLNFVGAVITKSDAEAWKRWREEAAAAYEQIGQLPGPWGYSHEESPDEQQAFVKSLGENGRDIAEYCTGYWRIKLPDDVLAQLIDIWPEDAGQFWVVGVGSYVGNTEEILRSGVYEDGMPLKTYDVTNLGSSYGMVRHAGGGYLPYGGAIKNMRAGERYPLLPFSLSSDKPITEPQDSYARKLMVGPEWDGLLACGKEEQVDQFVQFYLAETEYDREQRLRDGDPDLRRATTADGSDGIILYMPASFDVDYKLKRYQLYINDQLVAESIHPLSPPLWIIDREGYLYKVAVVGSP
ncbi:MAG: hypothetical protein RIC52_08515 [Amphiplicatus sp.]